MRTIIAMMIAGIVLAACVPQTHVEGQRIRATGAATVAKVEIVQPDIHTGAPQWFKDYWVEYLGLVRGGYAVMALDQRMRAAQVVYCPSRCTNLLGAQRQSWKDVNYKHRALKACRKMVREEYPAAKPACAIYAIKDKIVWKGRLPWERGGQ